MACGLSDVRVLRIENILLKAQKLIDCLSNGEKEREICIIASKKIYMLSYTRPVIRGERGCIINSTYHLYCVQ